MRERRRLIPRTSRGVPAARVLKNGLGGGAALSPGRCLVRPALAGGEAGTPSEGASPCARV